jgi:hypothetical protein
MRHNAPPFFSGNYQIYFFLGQFNFSQVGQFIIHIIPSFGHRYCLKHEALVSSQISMTK